MRVEIDSIKKNNQMRKQMRFSKMLIALAGVAAMAWTPEHAYEAGAAGWAQKPGITLGGATAGVPPPGLYMIDQAFTYQSNLAGPGNSVINPHGTKTGVPAAVGVATFVWVPGWTFLGATYDAAWAIPVGMFAAGGPVNVEASGMINSFIAPVELSWKLGDSGFQVKTGLGMYVPDGTVTGVNGLENVGNVELHARVRRFISKGRLEPHGEHFRRDQYQAHGHPLSQRFITKGFSAFAQLSYRLWAPDEPVAAPRSPIYRK